MAKLGDRIDRFTLVRPLGTGGMATTWEAVRQVGPDFEQRVAIKLAERSLLQTRDGVESFRREAALAASLRHPNIAAVLDVDEQAGYIVCELVDGADLRAVLRAASGRPLEPALVVHIVAQIARGLSHAHRRILRGLPSPVIHRDMTPANVVIDYDGNVKIVDFGIAKVLVSGSDAAESIKGKLSYMAPEQAMGGRMDGRADQYALGVIAYEALSGVRPNDGSHDGETLACILAGKHVPLAQRVPSLPAGLTGLVERMLEPRPEQRFPTLDAVLDALAQFTPPLTIHRSLVPLVIAARQPHTIVRENGRFISQPVEAEPLLRAVFGTPSQPAPAEPSPRGRSLSPALPRTLGSTLDEAPARSKPLAAAPIIMVGTAAVPPRLPSKVRERESLAVSAIPQPTAQSSALQSLLASRLFWRCLTGLGAALLGLALWIAFAPPAFSVFVLDHTAAARLPSAIPVPRRD